MRFHRLGSQAERGAAATIVAVLFAFGVIFGVAALSVDVGALMFERRELQNAADAGALALAQSCAEGECTQAEAKAILPALMVGNALDEEHEVADVCVMNYEGEGDTDLPECPAPGTLDRIVECPDLPPSLNASVSYVEVRTTSLSDGKGFVRNIFAGLNSSGNSETTVASCARAAWGFPGETGITFPLAIRDCNWDAITQGGTKYFEPTAPYSVEGVKPPASAVSDPPPEVKGYVTHILAHATGNPTSSCGPDSMYAPGGFGWLQDAGGCSGSYAVGGVVPGKPGAEPPTPCKSGNMQKWVGKEVMIPVFSSVTGTGINAQYTLAGVSSFFFAGWSDLPAAGPKDYGVYKRPDRLPDSKALPDQDDFCATPGTPNYKKAGCIWGWFTSPILPVGTISPTAPDKGPTVIQMAG